MSVSNSMNNDNADDGNSDSNDDGDDVSNYAEMPVTIFSSLRQCNA